MGRLWPGGGLVTQLPRPQAPMVDRAGQPTREWYDYLRQVLSATDDAALQAQITAILARLDELEQAGSAEIRGLQSVRVAGSLAGGLVQLSLDGDSQSPGPSLVYGTDENGVKGFHAIPEPAVSFNLITSDADPFVTSDNDLLVVT